MIVVGSAGSGKTALTLEKLKHAEGEVLYVTHSAYLAQSARDLYYANGFEHGGQEAVFLSYREFVEILRAAGSRGELARFRRLVRTHAAGVQGIDAHQAFEEIRGVLSAEASGVLSRDEYLALGVRQSIFAEWSARPALRPVRKVPRLAGRGQALRPQPRRPGLAGAAAPRYDFVVVDEVQDITTVQLALVLRTLKRPGHFLLCGDSNQIVHPNFFSWSQVKSLFWSDPRLPSGRNCAC